MKPTLSFINSKFLTTLILTAFFSLNTVSIYAAENNSVSIETVPSCVKLCYNDKKGKARRGCSSSCLAKQTSCEKTGGEFTFQRNRYVCFPNAPHKIAKNS